MPARPEGQLHFCSAVLCKDDRDDISMEDLSDDEDDDDAEDEE